MIESNPTRSAINRARIWLSQHLSEPATAPPRARLLLACAIIFLVAVGVRLLYWQDMRPRIALKDTPLMGMTMLYEDEALRMRTQGILPNQPIDTGDARMIAHPPGYPILMAANQAAFGEKETSLRLFHVLVDAAAATMVLLIAAELLPFAAAIIAGFLVAVSPHFAHYSTLLLPDSLAGMPILIAVYLMVRAIKRPTLIKFIAAGAFIGCSCWLRSNGLLFAPFLGLIVLLFLEHRRRSAYSMALVGTALAFIAPITIRNWVVFDHFVPLSLGAGLTLMNGIADYDKEKRFGLPLTDGEIVNFEAEAYGRPDYGRHLWLPDGVKRDRDRFTRAAAIVRENPGWFFSVMLRRMAFMLRYNDVRRQNVPHNTSIAPTIPPNPGFGHELSVPEDTAPVWSSSPAELIAAGTIVSPQAEASLAGEPQVLRIFGGDSKDGNLFSTTPIRVSTHTDYLLKLMVNMEEGPLAIKVLTKDPRIELAIANIPEPDKRARRIARKRLRESGGVAPDPTQPETQVLVPFATADAGEVRVVFSINGVPLDRPILQIGGAELYPVGPTPNLWTRYPRVLIGAVQKNIFKTGRILCLIIIGALLLAAAGRGRALALLCAVPAYYLSAQSIFHTEWRYVLPMHYFLFVMAAVAIYAAVVSMRAVIRKGRLIGQSEHKTVLT